MRLLEPSESFSPLPAALSRFESYDLPRSHWTDVPIRSRCKTALCELRNFAHRVSCAPPVREPATVPRLALVESPFQNQPLAYCDVFAVIGALVALADLVLNVCVLVPLLKITNLLFLFEREGLCVIALCAYPEKESVVPGHTQR